MASQADALSISDSLAYVYDIYLLPVSRSGADDMNDKIKGKGAWRDGLQFAMDPEYTIFVATADLGLLFDDNLEIAFVQYVIPLSVQGYESGQWFWQDLLSLDSVRGEGAVDSMSHLDRFNAVFGYCVENSND